MPPEKTFWFPPEIRVPEAVPDRTSVLEMIVVPEATPPEETNCRAPELTVVLTTTPPDRTTSAPPLRTTRPLLGRPIW
jgi:hypothetical protein